MPINFSPSFYDLNTMHQILEQTAKQNVDALEQQMDAKTDNTEKTKLKKYVQFAIRYNFKKHFYIFW